MSRLIWFLFCKLFPQLIPSSEWLTKSRVRATYLSCSHKNHTMLSEWLTKSGEQLWCQNDYYVKETTYFVKRTTYYLIPLRYVVRTTNFVKENDLNVVGTTYLSHPRKILFCQNDLISGNNLLCHWNNLLCRGNYWFCQEMEQCISWSNNLLSHFHKQDK